MIKVSELAAEVRRIAEAMPEENYYDRSTRMIGHGGACRYQINGDPACIVGVALHNLGVPSPVLARFDNKSETMIWHLAYSESDIFEIDNQKELLFLDVAQNLQDSGDDWGEILSVT